MALLERVVVATLPLLPNRLMRSLAMRYIAGETLEQALTCLAGLEQEGYRGAIDLLGEDVTGETEARAVAREYAAAASALHERGSGAYISIKPTHMGLRVSDDLAFELYAGLLRELEPLGTFVRVEMEDHTTTDATLRLFEELRKVAPERVGIVLQSRLYRTAEDIAALTPGPLSVRMVKGIYLEPESIAHTEFEGIREAYLEGVRQLWQRGARVALATHDASLAEELIELAQSMGVGMERYEFQVLLGVQEPLWSQWRAQGHPVRVYVPYGPNWRAYSTRRLQKNPQIVRHLMRDLVRT